MDHILSDMLIKINNGKINLKNWRVVAITSVWRTADYEWSDRVWFCFDRPAAGQRRLPSCWSTTSSLLTVEQSRRKKEKDQSRKLIYTENICGLSILRMILPRRIFNRYNLIPLMFLQLFNSRNMNHELIEWLNETHIFEFDLILFSVIYRFLKHINAVFLWICTSILQIFKQSRCNLRTVPMTLLDKFWLYYRSVCFPKI